MRGIRGRRVQELEFSDGSNRVELTKKKGNRWASCHVLGWPMPRTG
jgi:hypothetical protein